MYMSYLQWCLFMYGLFLEGSDVSCGQTLGLQRENPLVLRGANTGT